MSGNYSTSTRVTVTIEIDGSGPYGPEWRVEDIIKQSSSETLNGLRERLMRERIRIVGDPVVSIITFRKGT